MHLLESIKKKKIYFIIVIFLIFFVFLINLFFIYKDNFKQNIAQNLRILTCQPNFTTTKDSTKFKIKRLAKGFKNFIKNGCDYETLNINDPNWYVGTYWGDVREFKKNLIKK